MRRQPSRRAHRPEISWPPAGIWGIRRRQGGALRAAPIARASPPVGEDALVFQAVNNQRVGMGQFHINYRSSADVWDVEADRLAATKLPLAALGCYGLQETCP